MNILAKILNSVKYYQRHAFLGGCIVLVSIISFNLGRINALDKTPLKVVENSHLKGEVGDLKADIFKTSAGSPRNTTIPKILDKRVVASKASSSKKYHFTWCPGGKKIKEENKIWFENESLAQQAGYSLAGNCN